MIIWFGLPRLRSDTNRTSFEVAADLAGVSPSARQAALWAVTSQTPHMGQESLLPSSSLRPVVSLVSVLLQEKLRGQFWELCETALMTAREAPPSAPAVDKIWDQWKSQELQSLKYRAADSRVSPLVVPGQNEMQRVEIILEKQSPDVLSPFIVHFMPSESLPWVKGTWFNQKSTCNLHRLLSHLVSMLWGNRDCLQEKKNSLMSKSLLKY